MIELPRQGDPSLVYMYGLSDFWTEMFGDKQLVESLLAGETLKLGEAYSYFLQRAAGISLEDVQEKYQTRIKLILLGDDDLVSQGDLTKFKLSDDIVGIEKIANRPILPTQTLSYGVHFDISDGVITFHKPMDELKFPVRYNEDGTWQYAIWMCDVEINERWLQEGFGRLVGFKEEDAIFNYKSFLEGVYFLYTNGPNVSFIERGVNLAMGMPYARATEEVLEVYQDEVTSNWVVFTSSQSYEVPYSFQPNIKSGDILVENQVLTTWVEVIDHTTSGAWWYQIYLPKEVLAKGTDPVALGKAIQGSPADRMMNDFLKHHMFEVLITQPSSDITAFNTARDLVLRAKPEYTFPVFVWKASITDEIINLQDDFKYTYRADRSDFCMHPPSIRFMDRETLDDGFTRGTNWYNRVQGSMYVASLLGYGDWPGNGGWAPQFDSITGKYSNYLGILMRDRGDLIHPTDRGEVIRGWRGSDEGLHEGLVWEVKSENVYGRDKTPMSINEKDLTPLYLMNRSELVDKMLTVDPHFKIGNQTRIAVKGLNLVDTYDTWMKRNSVIVGSEEDEFHFENSTGDLDIQFSQFAYQTYVPHKDGMYDEDGLPILDGEILINRCTDNSWSCQWVRRQIAKAPTLFPVEDVDYTRAIEDYDMSDTGKSTGNYGVAVIEGCTRVETPKVARSENDLILIVDGKYVNTYDYAIEVANTTYETSESPFSEPIDIVDRTYALLYNAPVSMGYLAYDEGSDEGTLEDLLLKSAGKFTLSESVDSRKDILVISDGEFIFDYTVVGDELILADDTIEDIWVRYVKHSAEESLPAGSSTYTLSSPGHCKIFVGSKLLEDWSIKRTGTILELPYVASEVITVRYSDGKPDVLTSLFNRGTVERNQARFLMDRDREDGAYDDYLGQTVRMNRGGVPTLLDDSLADSVKVIRRLR